MKVVARIPTEPGPVQVTVTLDQRFAYVANDGRGSVQKIELATNRVVKTIPIAATAGSHGVCFGVGGKLLFITNTCASTISIIDTTTDEIIDTVKVATVPEGIAFKRP